MRDLLRNERWSLLMLASMFVLAAVNSPFLPDRLPSHWTGGQVDSYAAKSTVLMFWPLFASGVYAAFLLATRHHGTRRELEPTLWWARTLFTAGALVICCGRLAAYWGFGLRTGLSLGIVSTIVGAAMPAIIQDRLAVSPAQRESRTEPSWVQSHRLCGKTLLACGTVMIGGSLLGVTVSPTVAVLAVAAGAVAFKACTRLGR